MLDLRSLRDRLRPYLLGAASLLDFSGTLAAPELRWCRHCGGPIRRCTSSCAGKPDYPLCKGWRHVGYDSQPVIGHCCGGRSINPAAEPREDGNDA